MPDEAFHGVVYILFGRQVEFRHVGLVIALRHFLHGLFDDVQALPHFFLTHAEAVVGVAVGAHRNDEIKILIAGIRTHHPHVVIDTCCAQVRAGKSVVQCILCGDAAHFDGAVHENAVAHHHFLEFLQGLREFVHELLNPPPDIIRKIALETADAADVGGEASAADELIDLVDLFAPLEYI